MLAVEFGLFLWKCIITESVSVLFSSLLISHAMTYPLLLGCIRAAEYCGEARSNRQWRIAEIEVWPLCPRVCLRLASPFLDASRPDNHCVFVKSENRIFHCVAF
jgi:hypothetical protein